MTPFLQLFQQTATFLTTPPQKDYALLAQCMVLLVEIFYDFTCHDLPPAIEDTHDQFFSPGKGWFHVFLAWDPVELRGDVSFYLHVNTSVRLIPFQIEAR